MSEPKKWLITWNAGYGESCGVVSAETETEAEDEAYGCWLEEANSNAEYSATPLTRELAEKHGFEHELEDGDAE